VVCLGASESVRVFCCYHFKQTIDVLELEINLLKWKGWDPINHCSPCYCFVPVTSKALDPINHCSPCYSFVPVTSKDLNPINHCSPCYSFVPVTSQDLDPINHCSPCYSFVPVTSQDLDFQLHMIFDFWCLTSLSGIFQLYRGDQF
jgi:hypothetical protein